MNFGDVLARAVDMLDPPPSPDPRPEWQPLPHQIPPDGLGIDYEGWLLMAGRGAGKTDATAAYISKLMRDNPGERLAIVAPTLMDARQSCVYGVSGLLAHDPNIYVAKTPDFELRWPNGNKGHIFGALNAEDVERLRAGGNRSIVWFEELAAMRKLADAMDQVRFGLRVGPHPHWVASTTPKNKPELKELVADERVYVSKANTMANPHLIQTVRDALEKRYAGKRIGRQELNAEIIEDVEGALWTLENIENNRIPLEELPELHRVVVGVDPPGTATGDECGILVVGRSKDPCPCGQGRGHGYVLRDDSRQGTPQQWASAVVRAFDMEMADRVAAEVNNGGDMVEDTLRTRRADLPIKQVRASRSKQTRAEPISALYEQGRMHHVGVFEKLEEQQTTWVPGEGDSPDRVDALVWAATELKMATTRRQVRVASTG